MHQITYRNVFNDWHNALPAGNGRMGAMAFFKENELHIALNHYDCYYSILPKHTESNRTDSKKRRTFDDPARVTRTYDELCRLVAEAKKKDDYTRAHYLKILHPEQTEERPVYRGSSYPMAGEIIISLDKRVNASLSCLQLKIEEGNIYFCAGDGEGTAEARVFVPKTEDGVIIDLSQSVNGLWSKVELAVPSMRGQGAYRRVRNAEGGLACLKTYFHSEGVSEETPPFVQETAVYLPEAVSCGEAALSLPEQAGRFTAFAAVMPGEGTAVKQCRHLKENRTACEVSHKEAWRRFWTSSVTLPDYFLETLWHLHVYLMECSCGRGSAYPEQSCGLSGLWDIRRPNMWGSMWYWDANIQSAFWGSYSSGHPELLKVFCDGYLSYEDDIRDYTKRVYGVDGWALDYPHTLYHCIQPWCAQFLWLYYRYSGDKEFLEEKAYPVFMEQIRFFRRLAKKDEAGVYHVELDISPEQGPVGCDSVATIASVKNLLSMALEAAAVLERPESEQAEIEEIRSRLPEYSKTTDGKRWKDSMLVEEGLFLRHPSVLMPVFPFHEITWESEKNAFAAAEETLKYAAENMEVGTFGSGWLAMAAACLKKGRAAQRILYEKLLDYAVHSNGLGYEESERFINYCHITKPPHYLPPMSEASGSIVNTVNLMLLQTGKAIHVFPAVPAGEDGVMEKSVQYREDDKEMCGSYPAWDHAEFHGLLAPGGFKVSAQRQNGKVTWIGVECGRDGCLKLAIPEELAPDGQACLMEREMKAGDWISVGEKRESILSEPPEILVHEAAQTHRRIFIGEDRDTGFYKAVDSFLCAYRFANDNRCYSTPYIFDFGKRDVKKNYDPVYHKQSYINSRSLLYAAGPKPVGLQIYDGDLGYGFIDVGGLTVRDREKTDDLRRDFVEGVTPAEFAIELPKGKYDFLVISGDEEEESYTTVGLTDQGTRINGCVMEAGRYQCRILPCVHDKDGKVSLRLESGKEKKWKLNGVIVNKEYAFL